jgi:hypothetical protein
VQLVSLSDTQPQQALLYASVSVALAQTCFLAVFLLADGVA